jgi:hypothetical protein
MDIENRIKRHGRHLMSLASAGALCIALAGLLLAAAPHFLDFQAQSWLGAKLSIAPELLARLSPQLKTLLSLKALAWTIAWLWPLLALRRLGQVLWQGNVLNGRTADAFRQLAHSIVASIVLQAAPDFLIGFVDGYLKGSIGASGDPGKSVIDVFDAFGSSLGLGGTYVAVIACVCLYSVAHLTKLAAAAADEARGFV